MKRGHYSRSENVGSQSWPAGIVVSYKSESNLAELLTTLTAQVGTTILVRNGPIPESERLHPRYYESIPALEILEQERNTGIGAALNSGFSLARARGHDTAVALDQDSVPGHSMVQHLESLYQRSRKEKLPAVVAPDVKEVQHGGRAKFLTKGRLFFFLRKECAASDDILSPTIVISSGSLFDLNVHRELGGFREDYFIDYVDTEYCLRARMAGFEVFTSCAAELSHRWGNSHSISLLGWEVRPTFHSPLRWYYISRNRIPTIREYGLSFPHWLLFDLSIAVWWFVRMLLFEDQRLRKVKAFVLGTWDGLMGRMGPCDREI